MAPLPHCMALIHKRLCRLLVVYLAELSEITMKLTMRLYRARIIDRHGVRTGMRVAGSLQWVAVRGYGICNFRH